MRNEARGSGPTLVDAIRQALLRSQATTRVEPDSLGTVRSRMALLRQLVLRVGLRQPLVDLRFIDLDVELQRQMAADREGLMRDLVHAPVKRSVLIPDATHFVLFEKNRIQFFEEILKFLKQ